MPTAYLPAAAIRMLAQAERRKRNENGWATSACWWHNASPHRLSLYSSLALSLDVLIPNICMCWRCFLSSGDVFVPVLCWDCGGKSALQRSVSLTQSHLLKPLVWSKVLSTVQFVPCVPYSRSSFSNINAPRGAVSPSSCLLSPSKLESLLTMILILGSHSF